MPADLIATCPVCPGETHKAQLLRHHGIVLIPRCPVYPTGFHALSGAFVARIDGGDPGDEQENRHG